jgi:hypothetical protein
MFDSFHDEVTEDEDDEAMVSQVSQWVQVMEELLIIHCSIFLKFVILLHSHGTGHGQLVLDSRHLSNSLESCLLAQRHEHFFFLIQSLESRSQLEDF